MQEITIANGCPICKSDVKGNDNARYFCKACNMLFSKQALEKNRD